MSTAPAPRPPFGAKPSACVGCSLHQRGHGFVAPEGPNNAPILLIGEAPGFDEAAMGRPFVGAAGSMLERILRRNRLARGMFKIGNVLQCVPPQMLLEGQPYQYSAIEHCRVHREVLLQGQHPVVLALGGTAIRTLLGLHGHPKVRVEEFHGTVHDDMEGRYKVVCSFHTSFLQRGAHNLIGTVSFDLQVALELARGEWQPQPIDLVIDPSPEWFEAWVWQLEQAALQDPDGMAIAEDIETPDKAGGKPENELGPDDDSYQILRCNFSCHPDQGVTVPYEGKFIPLIHRVWAIKCRHYWWNGSGYDWDRVNAATGGTVLDPWWQYDMMLGAHVIQSDVPLGLGFWAPFYSQFGAWKYKSETDKEWYACVDGPQTWRAGTGILGDLIEGGQWRAFEEDCHELYHAALKPAQTVGILINKPELEKFHGDLAEKQLEKIQEMQQYVPEALRPLTGEVTKKPAEVTLHPAARTMTLRGLPKKDQPDPIKAVLYQTAIRVERTVERLVTVCKTCGEVGVHKKHRCKRGDGKIDQEKVPEIVAERRPVVRWFWQEPFNPDSPQQMMTYIKTAGHRPGKSKQTRKDSADRETLIRLAKSTKDPFYQTNLDYRAIKKVDSTYAVPTLRRIEQDPEGRLHPIPTFRPSTMRLSYISPNITNVVADKDKRKNLAAGFRRCMVAGPGCRLLEVDYAGIEAVETGWYARYPAYIRLARLGVHAYLASHLLGRPADLGWSDHDLTAYFKELKQTEPWIYDQAKRCVHGTNYGLTPYGMAATFPEIYPDLKAAQKVQDLYFSICPALPTWHHALRQRAYDAGWLGGPGEVLRADSPQIYTDYLKNPLGYGGPPWWSHPFQYKHHFWSVLAYKPISEAQRMRRVKARKQVAEINGRWFAVDWGEDSKRVIALFPQSTAAGVLKRSIRALFTPGRESYIGDAYYGRTPLRAPIHDSLLLEVPDRSWDRVVEAVAREMLRPVVEQPLPASWQMGAYLTVGVDAKVGHNWMDVEGLKLPRMAELGLSNEETYFGTEESDEEDAQEMRVVA